jgi:hypothetical protein
VHLLDGGRLGDSRNGRVDTRNTLLEGVKSKQLATELTCCQTATAFIASFSGAQTDEHMGASKDWSTSARGPGTLEGIRM